MIKKKLFSKLNLVVQSKSYASRFIFFTILDQKKYLFLNLTSGLLNAFLEGISLSIVFLLISLISSTTSNKFDWASIPLLSNYPSKIDWLSNLPFINVFIGIIIIAIVTQIFQSFFKYVNLLTASYIEAKCLSQITTKIHRQVFSFSYRCSQKYKTGDLAEYVNQCPETIRNQIKNLSDTVSDIIIAIVYIFILIRLLIWNAFFVVILLFIAKFFLKYLSKKIKQISEEITILKVRISETIIESFQGIRYFHSSGLINEIDDELTKKTNSLENRLRARGRKIEAVLPSLSLIPTLLIASVCLFSIFALDNSLFLATLATFAITLQRLNNRIILIVTYITALIDNIPKVSRLDEIISPQGKEFRRSGGKKINFKINQITFSKINFKYSNKDKFKLKDINFKLKLGEITSIVGKSGSGKSSIIDLLIGLYEPISGEIIVNEESIKDLDLNYWQKNISVVDQDIFLFNTSILENIKFGNPYIEFDQIKKACEDSGAHEFIQNLPNGYETIIGERGFKLSGGQRQRIAIARALVRDAPILIFDEATSALDSLSENTIQSQIKLIKKEKLILVIAHRLSTIKNSDNIIVVNNGTIAEKGNHQTLLQNDHIYKKLWNMQANG